MWTTTPLGQQCAAVITSVRSVNVGRPSLEVDPHDHPPGGGADLLEPGVLEDLTCPHMHFAPGDLLARHGDDRVGLERSGAALTGEVDRGPGERIGEAAPR